MEEKVAIRAFRAQLRNWQVFASPFRVRKTPMRSKKLRRASGPYHQPGARRTKAAGKIG
jgi:hypothetical protein